MTKMSFMDKIQVLIDITSSSNIFIVVILSLLFLAYMFITINKKNLKNSKFTYFLIYDIVIASLLFTYRKSLGNMFDYLVDNLFIIIYFPNLAVYLSAIIVAHIILWISVFKQNISKLIKVINVLFYIVITYILILVLNVINLNNLDVFTQSSIYSNSDALALIELSSSIFMVWIVFLIIYTMIRSFQRTTENEAIEQAKVVKKEKTVKLPKDYTLIEAPYVIKQDNDEIKVEATNKINDYQYNDLLTLGDYKLLLNILKDHKQKEKEEQEKLKKQEDEQSKYIQLQELYKSVR